MEQINLQGSIDLLRLEKVGLATIHGVRCVVIPIAENDLYVSKDIVTDKAKACYMSINIYASKQEGKYGDTHYAKQSFSREYREGHPDAIEQKKKVYLGNFKPLVFENVNQAGTVSIDEVKNEDVQSDELPF